MLSDGKARSQSRAVVAAVRYLLGRTWDEKLPADRLLSAYVREHRELGGRDRRAITEIFYAVCRWWGWLRPLAPAPASVAEDASWIPLLLAALLMENIDSPDVCRHWLHTLHIQTSRIRQMPPESRSVHRAEWLLETLDRSAGPRGLRLEALVPDWVGSAVRSPKSLAMLVTWLQRRSPLWLRIQHPAPDRVLAELKTLDLDIRPHPRLARAVAVHGSRVNLYNESVYREGRVEIQDLASQAVGVVCAPSPGERWWDACAGGGGKSLLLAQLMQGRGTVVASDIRVQKLEELRRRATRAGLSNIAIREWNGKAIPQKKASFDGVLADVPCSGSGTWRRNPAARWTLVPADLERFAALQREILDAAATGVRPGGVLVYATCSMFHRENEDVVHDFLRRHPAFRPEPFEHPLTGERVPGMIQFWPWDGDCDALFAARLRHGEKAVRL